MTAATAAQRQQIFAVVAHLFWGSCRLSGCSGSCVRDYAVVR